MVTTAAEKTKSIQNSQQIRTVRAKPAANRPAIEPLKNYTREEAAKVVPCAQITLIRAYDNGFLSFYRVGRRILHSGQHLIDWLEAGGKTGHGRKEEEPA